MRTFKILTVLLVMAVIALEVVDSCAGPVSVPHAVLAILSIMWLSAMTFAALDGFILGRRKKEVLNSQLIADIYDLLGLLKDVGSNRVDDILSFAESYAEAPYEGLKPELQVMKSEKSAIHARLRETSKFLKSDEFKSWTLEKRVALYRQAGAMTLYLSCLMSRCLAEGVLKKKCE